MLNIRLYKYLFLLILVFLSACDKSSDELEAALGTTQSRPQDGSNVAGPAILFEWADVIGESQYILEISSSEDFSTAPVFIDDRIPANQTSYNLYVPKLEEQKTYYWRVLTEYASGRLMPVSGGFSFLYVYAGGIHFQETTGAAGINHISPSFGVSWGDFNGDGWLDLWSGNHYTKPSLYINQGDGSFIDIATFWNPDIRDAHGAAWIDLDGDGKDELLQISGGGILNRLVTNVDDVIVDNALAYALEIPEPRGRSPLWFDWNNDGNSEVVLTRITNSRTQPLVLQNENGNYTDYTDVFNVTFDDSNYSQLADLNGDKKLDLVFHNRISFPAKVYDMATQPFAEISPQLSIPINTVGATYDSVIADLDNNLRNDIFVVKRKFDIELFQRSSNQLDAKVIQTANYPVKKYSFVTTGNLKISAYLYNGNFTPANQIFIGADRVTAEQFQNTVEITPIFHRVDLNLEVADIRVEGQLDSTAIEADIENGVAGARGLFIGFDAALNEWQIITSLPNQTVNIVIESSEIITATDTGPYWTGLPAKAKFNLYMHSDANNFLEQSLERGLGEAASCGAVVGADFDNDMDIDLYLVCTNGVSNIPNKLFENDGQGNFTEVADAAGASGSNIGQGENVAYADYDKDGFLDIFVVNGENLAPFHNGPHQLFRNIPNANNWIEIELKSRFSAKKGLGSTIVIDASGVKQMREQNGGYHRYSQNSQMIHFGLAKNEIIDTLTVYWPSGIIQILTDVSVNQILTITEKGTTGCSDALDNNNDQLIDFPDDISCTSWQGDEN